MPAAKESVYRVRWQTATTLGAQLVEKTRRAEVVPIRCRGGGPDSSTWCHASVHHEHRPSHAADIATTAPRTPPTGCFRTAGLKDTPIGTPAHWPLGRREGAVARGREEGSPGIRWWRRRCQQSGGLARPPIGPRGSASGTMRQNRSIPDMLYERAPAIRSLPTGAPPAASHSADCSGP